MGEYQNRKAEGVAVDRAFRAKADSLTCNPLNHTQNHSVYLLLNWPQISCLLWNNRALQIPCLLLLLQLKLALSSRSSLGLPIDFKDPEGWWALRKGSSLHKSFFAGSIPKQNQTLKWPLFLCSPFTNFILSSFTPEKLLLSSAISNFKTVSPSLV